MSRQVVASREVCHLWAHKAQQSTRNSGNSLFFTGDSIWSYGTHFLMAMHVSNSRNEDAILYTTASYSKTTSKHLCWVRQSIPRSAQVFSIDLSGFREVSADIVNEYNQCKEEKLAKALRARTNREWLLGEVTSPAHGSASVLRIL